jgi:hypothetical protein
MRGMEMKDIPAGRPLNEVWTSQIITLFTQQAFWFKAVFIVFNFVKKFMRNFQSSAASLQFNWLVISNIICIFWNIVPKQLENLGGQSFCEIKVTLFHLFYNVQSDITCAVIGQTFATWVSISEDRYFLCALSHFIASKYSIKAI